LLLAQTSTIIVYYVHVTKFSISYLIYPGSWQFYQKVHLFLHCKFIVLKKKISGSLTSVAVMVYT